MKEIVGDFWTESKKYDALVVTTNGVVKRNGELVMGKGIAKEFALRFPSLPKQLGQLVLNGMNKPYYFEYPVINTQMKFFEPIDSGSKVVISFPTKHHWKDKSDIKLIEQSAKEIVHIVDHFPLIQKILMTQPGCGCGGLKWENVKPILEKYLDDRFVIINK